MIPYGKHLIDEDDIASVISVLRSDFLTQGEMVPQFERAVCARVGARHGVAVNSATSALHVACLALNLSPGDIFWTSSISFVASANCGLYCGATVDFVDIDPKTFNISVDLLERKLIIAEALGKLPKLLIVVHMAGLSCDMVSIRALGDRYGFSIIEDASHALGGRYLNLPIGSCQYSDITIFSFHPVKIITSGEGGMAVTNNDLLAREMQLLRSHGITRDPTEMVEKSRQPVCYEQITLGFNYRMTDIHAAIGLSQLNKLDSFVTRRNDIANIYLNRFAALPLSTQRRDTESYSAYHLFIIQPYYRDGSRSRDLMLQHLLSKGIICNIHYRPIMAHPYFNSMGFDVNDYPNALHYYQTSLSIPIFPGMAEEEITLCIDSVTDFLV